MGPGGGRALTIRWDYANKLELEVAGEIGENGKQKGERVSKEERIRREEASVFIVGLSYGDRNVQSHNRRKMLHFLAFRDSPIIPLRCSPGEGRDKERGEMRIRKREKERGNRRPNPSSGTRRLGRPSVRPFEVMVVGGGGGACRTFSLPGFLPPLSDGRTFLRRTDIEE